MSAIDEVEDVAIHPSPSAIELEPDARTILENFFFERGVKYARLAADRIDRDLGPRALPVARLLWNRASTNTARDPGAILNSIIRDGDWKKELAHVERQEKIERDRAAAEREAADRAIRESRLLEAVVRFLGDLVPAAGGHLRMSGGVTPVRWRSSGALRSLRMPSLFCLGPRGHSATGPACALCLQVELQVLELVRDTPEAEIPGRLVELVQLEKEVAHA